MPIIDLSDILNIIVIMPGVSAPTQSFSIGLLLSQNTIISTSTRVVLYNSSAAMIAAGFSSTSAEVLAATLYFAQTPEPSQIAVGVWGTGETAVQALTACRLSNSIWYLVDVLGAVDSDIELLAPAVEGMIDTNLFYTTSDAAVLAGTAGNLALTLQSGGYNHTHGIYSTTANAAAAVMGLACGLNTGSYGSFTLADKGLTGVTPEPITQAQLGILEGQNINVYTTRFGVYKIYEYGVMASGVDFGDIVGLDILTQNMQSNVMSLRMSSLKVPQTDAGVTQYDTAITQALVAAYDAGFLAAGIWDGPTVGSVVKGETMLPQGFAIQAGSVADLSASDIQNRKAPPVYVCIYKAGNIRKFVLTVYTNS